jgi:hypothetical protein
MRNPLPQARSHSPMTTHHPHNPSQILISNPLFLIFVQLALGLDRRSTLPHLAPEMQAFVTSKQKRLPSKIAVDILAAVRRVDPLACRSAVAFGWALEDECNIGVRWICERDALGRWRGLRDVGEGLDGDGLGDGAVREGEEQISMKQPEDCKEDSWLEISEVALRRHGEL